LKSAERAETRKEMSVSDTPKLADECKRLLDNGWRIQLFANDLGSYTARATSGGGVTGKPIRRVETDDFEPSQALYRLTEKALLRRIV
jgi:hypothetical protein